MHSLRCHCPAGAEGGPPDAGVCSGECLCSVLTETPTEIGVWSLARATLGYKGNVDRTQDILDWLSQRLSIKSDGQYSEANFVVMQRKLSRLSGRGLEELLLCIGIWMQDNITTPQLKKSMGARALTAESICNAAIAALQDDLSVLFLHCAGITKLSFFCIALP